MRSIPIRSLVLLLLAAVGPQAATKPMAHYHHNHELRRPCPRTFQPRVTPPAARDAHEVYRSELLAQCDCGNLRGCRCGDALWDSLDARPDPAAGLEEGMDDQGYRQLGGY